MVSFCLAAAANQPHSPHSSHVSVKSMSFSNGREGGRLGGDGVGAEEGGGIAPSGADCCWHETELPETSKGVKSVKSNAIYSFMTVEPFVKV